MASVNPLLELWRSGKPSLGGWLTTADPQIVEYLATCGFDEICVDQQHGLADGARLANCLPGDRAARGRADHARAGQRFRRDRQRARCRGGRDRRADGRYRGGGSARRGRMSLPAAWRSLGRSVARLAGACVEATRGARRGRLRGHGRDRRGPAPTSTRSPPRPVSTRSTSAPATSASVSGCRPGRRTGPTTRRSSIATRSPRSWRRVAGTA